MESKVIREIERRFLNGFMDLLILLILYRNSFMSGYDVIKHLHERFAFLPSAGTVYSHIYAMERAGLLRGTVGERKRVYTLTLKGKKKAEAVARVGDRIGRFVSMVLSRKGA